MSLTAASFWFASIRYVGLDSANYNLVVLGFWLLTCTLAVRCWAQGLRKGGALTAVAWATAIVVGELPWRLNSRGWLDGLWEVFGLPGSDVQKLAAVFCLEATMGLFALLLIAVAVEGARAWRPSSARPPFREG